MAKILPKRRSFEIKKKQKRSKKLKKLRLAFIESKTKQTKQAVLEKVFKIAPHISEQEFLDSLKQEKESE